MCMTLPQFLLSVSAVTCSDLIPPPAGVITYSGGSPDNRPVGTVATYGCDPGFTLNGGSTRTCQSDGTWSGPAPTCQGMHHTF